jgi:hypothetical protein
LWFMFQCWMYYHFCSENSCHICELWTTYWESRPLSKLLVEWYLDIYLKESCMVIMGNNKVDVTTRGHWVSQPDRPCKQVYFQQPLNWSKCNAFGGREIESTLVHYITESPLLKHL